MKLHLKKIIAREFLLVILAFFLSLIFYLGTYLYNYFRLFQINKIEKSIAINHILVSSLSNPLQVKQVRINLFKENANIEGFDTTGVWERLVEVEKADSIKYYWDNKWSKDVIKFTKKQGFLKDEEFKSFILSTKIDTVDIKNYNKSQEFQENVNDFKSQKKILESKVLSGSMQIDFGIGAAIILVFLLFPLRYFFYSTSWSIKTLKEK